MGKMQLFDPHHGEDEDGLGFCVAQLLLAGYILQARAVSSNIEMSSDQVPSREHNS